MAIHCEQPEDIAAMRIVPLDKLLLQPRVHLQWIRKAGALGFEVGSKLAERFVVLWQQYEREGFPSPPDFLDRHPLTEQDRLFALFAGAVYLHRHLPEFQVRLEGGRVVWDSVRRETLVHSSRHNPSKDTA